MNQEEILKAIPLFDFIFMGSYLGQGARLREKYNPSNNSIIPGKGCHVEKYILLPSHAISCWYCSLHISLSGGIHQLRKHNFHKIYILYMPQHKTMASSTVTYWLTLVKVLYLYSLRSQLKLKAKQQNQVIFTVIQI